MPPPPPADGCFVSALLPETGRSSRPSTSEGKPSARRPVGTPGSGTSRGNSPANPGGGNGGRGVESNFGPWGEGGGVGGAAGELGRGSPAVGGGNTDANRPVGVPYPFRAAAAKHGSAGGAANETLLRYRDLFDVVVVPCAWCPGERRPNKTSAFFCFYGCPRRRNNHERDPMLPLGRSHPPPSLNPGLT